MATEDTFRAIREGLAVRLDTLQDVQASAWFLDAPTPPSIMVVGPDDTEYDTYGMGASVGETWLVLVQGFAGLTGDRASQTVLDRWLSARGDTSVKKAIEGDRTLGGVADTCRVTNATGYRVYTLAIGRVFGAEWTVQVETS